MASSVGSEATTIGDNVGLVAAMIAVVVAQVLKPFSDWTVTGRFKAGLMVGSGGFPSSHSSLVTALATGAAYQSGLGDPAFATALVLALVVRAAPSPRRVPPAPRRASTPLRDPPGTQQNAPDDGTTPRATREGVNEPFSRKRRAPPRRAAARLPTCTIARLYARTRSVSDHHD